MFLGYKNNKIKFYTEERLDEITYNLNKVVETDDEYIKVGDEYVLTTDIKAINQAKQNKTRQNDIARDLALNAGVEYKGVLFDSDTDQKVNLLATVSMMSDIDVITWFGMDNQPLECTKEDLLNIGGLITTLHSFCWNKNAEIKEEINNAETIEEVDAVIIDYSMPLENINESEVE